MEPLVSVIMSAYNAEAFLEEAVKSILNQTYKKIEFIIINDGSTDCTTEILGKYEKIDNRIKIIDNDGNKGLIYSLNKGIEYSKGKYIVRMDADDISRINRIEKQVDLMESNEDIAISGSNISMFMENKKYLKRIVNAPKSNDEIKANSLFETSFFHPTVIIKREIFLDKKFRYNENDKYAEDYGLWNRIIIDNNAQNIDEVLLDYRIVKTSETRKANKDIKQRELVFKKIYSDYIKQLGYNILEKDLDIHFEISTIQNLNNSKYSLNEKLEYLNELRKYIKLENINSICAKQFMKNCLYENQYKVYKSSELYKYYKITYFKYVFNLIVISIKKYVKSKYK